MYQQVISRMILLGVLILVGICAEGAFGADNHSGDERALLSSSASRGYKRSHDDDRDEGQNRRLRKDERSFSYADEEDEEGDDDEIGGREDARSFAELAGEQVYANPIFDAAAKYLLADDSIRLGFMKAFIGNPHIVSTELLDTSLNPLRTLTQARDFLGDKRNSDIMDRIRKEEEAGRIKVTIQSDGAGEEEIRNGGDFLLGLSHIFGDIKKKIPRLERQSQLDVACRLANGEFVLVEVQVKPQDFWDKRALYYASAFYGNQLKRGGKWADLKKVIAINLLGGQSRHWRDAPMELVRHYKFVSTVSDHYHEIDSLQLIQYNLLSPQIDGLSELELKEWLQFWKGAHRCKTEEDVAEVTTEAVRRAYNRVKVANLPEYVRAGYEAEVADYLGYSQHIQYEKDESRKEGVEEGRQEEKLSTAEILLGMGLSDEQIMQVTRLTAEQLEEVKTKNRDG